MKYSMLKSFFTILLCVIKISTVNSQITILEVSTPTSIDKCGDSKSFELSIANSGTNSVAGSLLLNLPPSAYYEAGSISGGATENDITNLSQATFNLTVPPLASVNISFSASVSCDFDVTDSFNYNFEGNSLANPIFINQVNTPNLLITDITNDATTATIGDIITRDITIIQNSSNSNQLNQFYFTDQHEVSINVQNIEIVVGGAVITGGTFDSSTSTLSLDSTAIQVATGGSDGFFNNGETIVLRETIELVNYTNTTSDYAVYWSCYNPISVTDACQVGAGSALINLPVGTPNITVDYSVTQKIDICTNMEADIIITNDGSGVAYNVVLPIGPSNDGTAVAANVNIGYLENLYHLVNATINGTTILNDTTPIANAWNLVLNSFTTDPDGVGGLEDINGDGNYGELAPGASTTIHIEVEYDEDWYIANNTCMDGPFGHYNSGGNVHFEIGKYFEALSGEVTYLGETNSNTFLWIQRQVSAAGTSDALNIINGQSTYINVDYTMSFSVGGSSFLTNGGEIKLKFILSSGLVYDSSQSIFHDGTVIDPADITYTAIDNTLIVKSQNNYPGGLWKIPITLDTSIYTSPANIQSSVLMIPGNCPSKVLESACTSTYPSFNVVGICNTSINMDSFEAKRVSFGFTDTTGDTRVQATDAGINLKAAHPYENVDFILDGTITSIVNQGYASISYINTQSIGNVTVSTPYFLENSIATVKNITTGNTINNVPVIDSFDGDKTHFKSVDLDALENSLGGYNINDTIQVTIHTTTSTALPQLYEQMRELSGIFSSTNNGNIEKCILFTEFYLEDYDSYNAPTLRFSFNNCQTPQVKMGMMSGPSMQDYEDHFPNEIHATYINSTTMSFEGNWSFVSGTVEFYDSTNATNNTLLPDSALTVSFDGTNTTFTATNDGSWPLVDEYRRWHRVGVQFNIKGNCNIPDGLVHGTYHSDVVDFYYAVSTSNQNHEIFPPRQFSPSVGMFYYNLTKQLAPLTPTYFATELTARWDFRIENTTNYTASDKDIDNAWFLFSSNTGGIIPNSLQEIDDSGIPIGSPITLTQVGSSDSWFAPIGTISGGTARDFRIISDFTSCSTDYLNVKMGNHCSGYPSIVGNELVYNTITGNLLCGYKEIDLELQPQQIQLESSLTQPSGNQLFCTELNYSLNIKNIGLSRAYNHSVSLSVPNGLEYIAGSSQLVYNGSTISLTDPIDTSGILSWTFDSTILPEIGAYSDTISNEYTINFRVKPICGFVSGSKFKIRAEASSGCGETNSTILFSDPIELDGAPPYTNVYTLTTSTTDFVSCGENTTISVLFNHIAGDPTSSNEYIEIIVPNNITYQSNIVAINNTPTYISNLVSGAYRTVRFKINPNINPGETVEFSFDVAIDNSSQYTCSDAILIESRAILAGNNQNCDGITCSIFAVTANAPNLTKPILKQEISITDITSNSVLTSSGENLTVTFNINNNGIYDTTDTLNIAIAYDSNYDGDFNLSDGDYIINPSLAVTDIIPANTNLSQSITVPVSATEACSLLVVMNLNDNPCICDSIVGSIPIDDSLAELAIDDQTICSNNSISIGNTAILGYTYQWTSTNTTYLSYLDDISSSNPLFQYTGLTLTAPISIPYTVTVIKNGSCTASDVIIITLEPSPNSGTLTGVQDLCLGDSTTFVSNGDAGGTWTSDNSTIAVVDNNGNITSIAAGTTNINYTVLGGTYCNNAISSRTVTITAPANAGTISGNQAICLSDTSTLTTDGDAGGTWSSNDTTIATVDNTGLVTSIAAGTTNIIYTVTSTGICSNNETSTLSITITTVPNAGTITGNQAICLSDTSTLTTDGDAGGTWSSNDTTIATVDNTGLVTSIAAGTTDIMYTVTSTGGCPNETSTLPVTITAPLDAGTDTSITATCDTIDLVAILGTSNTTGTWSPALASGTNIFDPLNDNSGVYTYTITGTAPCGNASATVTVNNDWDISDCDNDGVLNGLEFDGDTDGDGLIDYLDNDDDGDGILTIDEDNNENGDWFDDDCNYNSVVDYLDPISCDLIPDAFTPNGDGENDLFIIPALNAYPNFEITIFNRWGNIVHNYKNEGRTPPLWWNGIADGKDEKVPVGTYYFIINYNKGDKEPTQDWLYLNY